MPDAAVPLFPDLALRLPPANLAAEQAILGALLHNNKVRERCLDLLPEHFADREYGQLYAAMIERIDLGQRVDGVSLNAEFDSELLAGLLAAMVGFHIENYVDQVTDCAARRRLIEIGSGLVNQAFSGPGGSSMAGEAASRLDEIVGAARVASGGDLHNSLSGAVEAMSKAIGSDGSVGISTGFTCLDERLGGLEGDTLTVIAARPGMGKSALAVNIAINAARRGIPALLFSLEMSRIQLARRVLASATGIPAIAIQRGRVGVDGAGRVIGAAKKMSDLPIWIEDAASVPASVIGARTRAWRRRFAGPGIVLVDHLHIVRPEDGDIRSGATYAVGQISLALKRISKMSDVPVIALAQLNRGVESRDDKRPGLADLRQSGDIEQNADSIGFIYRPEYYTANKPERKPGELDPTYESRVSAWESDRARIAGKAELIWAKVRNGTPGSDDLYFHGPTTSFSEDANAG